MKVMPVASPAAVQQTFSNETATKSRAIEAFNKASAPQTSSPGAHPPGFDQNNISAENLSAVSSSQSDQNGHKDHSEAVEETTPVLAEEAKPVEPKEQDPALSRQFAQLARQERALRAKVQQQEQAIQRREQELMQREEAIRAKDTQYSKGYISQDRLKQDPLSVLAEAGLSYDELTQQILSQGQQDPRMIAQMRRLEDQIRQLEGKNEESKKFAENQQTQAYQAAVKQIETDVRNAASRDPRFEMVKTTGSYKDVVQLIEEVYKKDGFVMDTEEAIQQVEDYLTDEALKLTRTEKIKRQLQASQKVAPQAQSQQKPQSQNAQQQPGMKTLTNATSSSRKLSAKERAVLAFKGELKNQ